MPLRGLTTNELEARIDRLVERINTINEISKDIKNASARKALLAQNDQYQASLDELRSELQKRRS